MDTAVWSVVTCILSVIPWGEKMLEAAASTHQQCGFYVNASFRPKSLIGKWNALQLFASGFLAKCSGTERWPQLSCEHWFCLPGVQTMPHIVGFSTAMPFLCHFHNHNHKSDCSDRVPWTVLHLRILLSYGIVQGRPSRPWSALSPLITEGSIVLPSCDSSMSRPWCLWSQGWVTSMVESHCVGRERRLRRRHRQGIQPRGHTHISTHSLSRSSPVSYIKLQGSTLWWVSQESTCPATREGDIMGQSGVHPSSQRRRECVRWVSLSYIILQCLFNWFICNAGG